MYIEFYILFSSTSREFPLYTKNTNKETNFNAIQDVL